MRTDRIKKILIAVLSIAASIVLFTVAFQWYFKPARLPEYAGGNAENPAEGLNDDNAAKYYLEACSLLVRLPEDDPAAERFEAVIEGKWEKADPELFDFILSNESALDLVRKGAEQELCSFPLGGVRMDLSYLECFRQLARLFIVEAKFFENQAGFQRAGECYVDALRFSADISDNGPLAHPLSGMAMEAIAYDSMESYIAGLSDEAVCEHLIEQLVALHSSRASMHDLLENELKYSRQIFIEYPSEYLYTRQLPENPNPFSYLLDAMRRAGGYVSIRLTAGRSRRQLEDFYEYVLHESQKSYPEIFDGKFKARIPDNEMSEIWFDTLYKTMHTIARYDVFRRANIIKMALHLHLLRDGAYPETLLELTGDVPQEILADPFSERLFVYEAADEKYTFYSLGPDLDDDGGLPLRPPYSPGSDGDLVFEPRHQQ